MEDMNKTLHDLLARMTMVMDKMVDMRKQMEDYGADLDGIKRKLVEGEHPPALPRLDLRQTKGALTNNEALCWIPRKPRRPAQQSEQRRFPHSAQHSNGSRGGMRACPHAMIFKNFKGTHRYCGSISVLSTSTCFRIPHV
jgi:hypothetical protein